MVIITRCALCVYRAAVLTCGLWADSQVGHGHCINSQFYLVLLLHGVIYYICFSVFCKYVYVQVVSK